jgi:hypothetical protein
MKKLLSGAAAIQPYFGSGGLIAATQSTLQSDAKHQIDQHYIESSNQNQYHQSRTVHRN